MLKLIFSFKLPLVWVNARKGFNKSVQQAITMQPLVPAKFGEVAFNTIREAHFCDFFSIYWDLSWLFEFLKIFMLNGKVEEKV